MFAKFAADTTHTVPWKRLTFGADHVEDGSHFSFSHIHISLLPQQVHSLHSVTAVIHCQLIITYLGPPLVKITKVPCMHAIESTPKENTTVLTGCGFPEQVKCHLHCVSLCTTVSMAYYCHISLRVLVKRPTSKAAIISVLPPRQHSLCCPLDDQPWAIVHFQLLLISRGTVYQHLFLTHHLSSRAEDTPIV